MKKVLNVLWLTTLSTVLVVVVAQNAFAQSSAGISGVVHDPSGAGVTGVALTIKNLSSDKTQNTTSDTAGGFSIRNLSPGSYEITAAKYGFADAKVRVVLDARRQVHTDLKLKLAEVEENAPVASVDAKKFEAMEARIEQLEAELKSRKAPEETPERTLLATATTDATLMPRLPGAPVKMDDLKELAANTSAVPPLPQGGSAPAAPPPPAGSPAPGQKDVSSLPEAMQAPEPAPAVDNTTPFAYGDFTWLNGTPRNHDTVLDTKFFTPEIRFDTHYMQDFNQPVDHTIGGATESFRAGEIQLEQASVGGDFHWENVRGRILFMTGLFATTTPRNDASYGVGGWDLRGAYKYTSEAYGGYHFNVQHGLNVDAGIFVSYIGLFSYYNYDNWTYQPSYVSSNTPWFFNGVRVQWFPTNKLKIEPWFINGWQSYGKFNSHPGLGGQILWMPTEWFKLVLNNYGHGQDNLGLPNTERLHTDDSIEVRFYNNPSSTGLSQIAMSITGDAGIQTGGGICGTCGSSNAKNSFLGWMAYNRYSFHKNLWALTFGGGMMNNPGRYLTLLPPINGADAVTGSPYFPQTPGTKSHMYDGTITLQYMPKEYITWWAEMGYRHADIPYFTGRGGITPPGSFGGTNGAPGQVVCGNGSASGTSDFGQAATNCGSAGIWYPDMRRSEAKLSFGVMVKF